MRSSASSRPHARALALWGMAAALAACGSATGPLEMPDNSKRERGPGVEAVLAPVNGSAAQGTLKMVERNGALTVVGAVNNLMPGVYRFAVHERGNCSSPNGFSAGKPWAPPGFPRPAGEMLPEIMIGSNGNGVISATLRGVTLPAPDGVEGRSVVVHAGARVDDNVVPGVPNRLVLCGVLGPVRSFMDLFRD
ncbi:MAG TPA: superoxide dismutase family protein [Casimicrobiaceae bacterium]|nr:superoxide dismutase family protein [Casimicrobiaceae bacterium]